MRLLFESGYLSRAAFIKLSVIGKIFGNCKGFEKSQFHKINEELRRGDLGLKQTFQLDQPPLCFKAVPTRHLQSIPSFLPMSSDDKCPLLLKKCQTSLDSVHSCTYHVYSFDICHLRHEVCSPAHVLLDY